MTIFLVTVTLTEDFYCEGAHVAGAFSTRELAERAIAGSTLKAWSALEYRIEEIVLDAPMTLDL